MARNAQATRLVEPGVIVRDARPDELAGIGDLRVAAYRADGFLLQAWPSGEMVQGAGEAEVRALAVAPHARGRGVGAALVGAVIERAASRGVRRLLLLTLPQMGAAHRLYTEAGFARLPERDWSPRPGAILLAYGLMLTP